MALNTVQVDFVNEAARPHMEQIVKALHVLDTFVADYDAIQSSGDALPINSTVLDDGEGGTAPREDAPTLTGGQVKALRDLSASMSAVVDAPAKEILVSRMVRPLAVVLQV